VLDHATWDLVRDILSAIVAGLFLSGVGSYLAHRREVKARLERHAVEIRHTQKAAKVDPFYEGNDL
jgi:hypothetical protein